MQVIPVLDILNGVAVHAIRGKRSEYQPLKSILTDSADPQQVATTFKACGFKQLYIADLDAILGKSKNLSTVSQIAAETGMELMVDAGISDLVSARLMLQSGATKVIVGTETLRDMDFVKKAIASYGAERVVVSLDLMNGNVLSKTESLRVCSPRDLAEELQSQSVTQLIVLDLARVGSGEGVDIPLLKEMQNLGLQVFSGGGVRNTEDLVVLRSMGVCGVLLATALHNGSISCEELKHARFL